MLLYEATLLFVSFGNLESEIRSWLFYIFCLAAIKSYAKIHTKLWLRYDKRVFALSQRYLDEAEREKMQYAQELKEYQQTEAYQITSAKIQDKKMRKGDGYVLMPK